MSKEQCKHITDWAYINKDSIKYLSTYTQRFNPNYDIRKQVLNYLDYIWIYNNNNEWILFDKMREQVAFNTFLKPSQLDEGDDYIYAVFNKNDRIDKQEWKLLCFATRGRTITKFGAIYLDLYQDCSCPPFDKVQSQAINSNSISFSFNFHHLFARDKDRLSRIPTEILDLFNISNSQAKSILCNIIKFSILNDFDNITEYTKDKDGKASISTSFDMNKLLLCQKPDTGSDIPLNQRIINELPYSYLYPVYIRNRNTPDFAFVFRKKGKGMHVHFIGKTILNLFEAQMNARIYCEKLEETWLSNEIVK